MSVSPQMAALQAKFRKLNEEGERTNRPNNYYPFWNIKEGEEAIVRFLPDVNEENPMGFIVEKRMHTLEINGENKSVPCLTMYGEECPICKVSGAFYKEGDKASGKKYWRKKQHIAQALIIKDPLPPEEGQTESQYEGTVRLLTLGYQIFEVVKSSFESGELDEVPFAFIDGTNFHIKKTKQGEYSTYAIGSKFARKSSDLEPEEVAFCKEHMVDLSTLLPLHPGIEKVESMLQAALTGAAYDEEANEEEQAPVVAKTKTQNLAKMLSGSNEEEDLPWEDEKPAAKATKVTKPAAKKAEPEPEQDDTDEAEQILARIRNRVQK